MKKNQIIIIIIIIIVTIIRIKDKVQNLQCNSKNNQTKIDVNTKSKKPQHPRQTLKVPRSDFSRSPKGRCPPWGRTAPARIQGPCVSWCRACACVCVCVCARGRVEEEGGRRGGPGPVGGRAGRRGEGRKRGEGSCVPNPRAALGGGGGPRPRALAPRAPPRRPQGEGARFSCRFQLAHTRAAVAGVQWTRSTVETSKGSGESR